MTKRTREEVLNELLANGTGSSFAEPGRRTVVCTFGRFEIKVVLGRNDKFLGIAEVSVKRDFLEATRRRRLSGQHDVEEYYPVEDDES